MTALGTRKLKIEIDGTEFTAEVSKAVFTSAAGETDFTTFFDAASGGARDYTLNIIGVQDPASGTFWSEVYDNTGDDVPVTVMPYGNDTPTVGEPHFTSTATISEPDGDFLGGEANSSKSARMTIEVAWECSRPVKVTT